MDLIELNKYLVNNFCQAKCLSARVSQMNKENICHNIQAKEQVERN